MCTSIGNFPKFGGKSPNLATLQCTIMHLTGEFGTIMCSRAVYKVSGFFDSASYFISLWQPTFSVSRTNSVMSHNSHISVFP